MPFLYQIFLNNIHGVFIQCNAEFEKIFGKPISQIIGKTIFDIAPKEFAEINHQKDNELLKNKILQPYESKLKYSSGEMKDILISKILYYNEFNNEIEGIIGSIFDITERKQLQEQLIELNQKLEQRVEEQTKKILKINKKLKKQVKQYKKIELRLMREQKSLNFTTKAFETLTNISRKFLSIVDFENSINKSIAEIGNLLDFEQISIFKFDNFFSKCYKINDWLFNEKNISFQSNEIKCSDIQWLIEQFKSNQPIIIENAKEYF